MPEQQIQHTNNLDDTSLCFACRNEKDSDEFSALRHMCDDCLTKRKDLIKQSYVVVNGHDPAEKTGDENMVFDEDAQFIEDLAGKDHISTSLDGPSISMVTN